MNEESKLPFKKDLKINTESTNDDMPDMYCKPWKGKIIDFEKLAKKKTPVKPADVWAL